MVRDAKSYKPGTSLYIMHVFLGRLVGLKTIKVKAKGPEIRIKEPYSAKGKTGVERNRDL